MFVYATASNASKSLAPIFQEMKWKWMEKSIPNEADLYDLFIRLEKDLLENESVEIRSGRLVVFKLRDSQDILYGLAPHSDEEWSNYCEIHHPPDW